MDLFEIISTSNEDFGVKQQLLIPIVNGNNEPLKPDLEANEDNNDSDNSWQRVLRPDGDIGVESLAKQCVDRVLAVRDGDNDYSFNIMLLGQTGVGKSTLIDSLFRCHFRDESVHSHCLPRVDVVSNYYQLCEQNVYIRLGVIECRGFDDQINKDKSYEPIIEYIDKQMDIYLEEELKIKRNMALKDTRVHVCLYLISPVGHGLKTIDLITMKELCRKTNLIPVIARSDQITRQEMFDLKRKIMNDIEANDIHIYRFPTDEPEVADINGESNTMMPFAVVASNEFVTIGGKEVRARQYPWGTVEVENKSHSDFSRLREMLLSNNMNDMRDKTHSNYYELYRSEALDELWSRMRSELYSELQQIEDDLTDRFETKCRHKECQLKTSAKELQNKSDILHKMLKESKAMEMSLKELDESAKHLDVRTQLLVIEKQKYNSNCLKDNKDLKSPKLKKK